MTVVGARFGHVNVIARDWQQLARFYESVFGCVPVPPERDYRGADLERGTGVAGSGLRGVHLRFPGHGEAGPTLEIYTYDRLAEGPPPAVNRPGWGHLAFMVDDVEQAAEAVADAGGGRVGDIVTLTTAVGTQVTWCYVKDPEGNVLELQSWADPAR